MKMVVNYLNFVFHIEVKTKSNYKILNFIFQFIKNTKWHFGYTDFRYLSNIFAKMYEINFCPQPLVMMSSTKREQFV